MKFVQALCETITGALGLTAFSPWGEGRDAGSQPFPIRGQHTLRGGVEPQPTRPPVTNQAQPVKALHTLFPEKYRKAPHGGEREMAMINQKLPNGGEDADPNLPPGPIFAPPNASPNFVCNYSAMRGWRHSAGNGARHEWLEKPIMDTDSTGGIYNIFTNYDQYAPIGTTRSVGLPVLKC